jgi:hypothetical protein
VIVSTVSRYLLNKYSIPESPNQQIRCLCHVINLVVQSILATLGEADDPTDNDHFLVNKSQPFHLDIDNDPDQVALDHEEFNVEGDIEENITLEDEEKISAAQSPLSKVSLHLLNIFVVLKKLYTVGPAPFYHKKDHVIPSTEKDISPMCNDKISKGRR